MTEGNATKLRVESVESDGRRGTSSRRRPPSSARPWIPRPLTSSRSRRACTSRISARSSRRLLGAGHPDAAGAAALGRTLGSSCRRPPNTGSSAQQPSSPPCARRPADRRSRSRLGLDADAHLDGRPADLWPLLLVVALLLSALGCAASRRVSISERGLPPWLTASVAAGAERGKKKFAPRPASQRGCLAAREPASSSRCTQRLQPGPGWISRRARLSHAQPPNAAEQLTPGDPYRCPGSAHDGTRAPAEHHARSAPPAAEAERGPTPPTRSAGCATQSGAAGER